MNYEIIKFKDGEFELDVNVSPNEDTVWLTLDKIAELFNRDKSVISRHIRNVFKESELDRHTSVAKNAIQINGQIHYVSYFNLDVITFVGYRTKSPRIEKFRSWALSIINVNKNSYSINHIDNNYEIVKFKDGMFELDVNVSPFKNDVYLSQKQMAELFEVTTDNISLHIKNILKEEEFDDPVSEESSVTARDGKIYKITIYNLDMIFAVGTRVKSRRGILFRKWAFKVLKEYLIKGYVINTPRLETNEINFLSLINLVQSLQLEVISTKERIKKLESINFPNQKLICNNTQFDSRIFFKNLLSKSKKLIILIDPYVDINTLDILKYRPTEASLTIITSDKSYLSKKELKSFISQYGEVTLIKTNLFHDRYLIIDNEFGYHVGTSLNYIGKKISQVCLLDKEILELLLNQINTIIN